MKRLIQLLGVLDFVALVRYGGIVSYSFKFAFDGFPLVTILSTLLIISFAFSGYFLLKMNKIGFWISYFQFPLRIAFLMLSFGFLTKVSILLGAGWYQPILWFAVFLEALRLIVTISFHRRKNGAYS